MRSAVVAGIIYLGSLAAFRLLAQEPVVAAPQRVSVGSNKYEALRKINNRWWTSDNRMGYPPKRNSGWPFWEVDSKAGVVDFYYHRPFDARLGEQLRLFLTPDEVEASFGQPNRRFAMGSGRGGRWFYIGSDGTILSLWIMERDELGEAEYLFPGGGEKPVVSIERELNGRSIFRVMAERVSAHPAPLPPLSTKRPVVNAVRIREMRNRVRPGSSSIVEVEMRNASQPVVPLAERFVEASLLDGDSGWNVSRGGDRKTWGAYAQDGDYGGKWTAGSVDLLRR